MRSIRARASASRGNRPTDGASRPSKPRWGQKLPRPARETMDLIIAPKAHGDIEGILTWTAEKFGPRTLRSYATLLSTALGEVAAHPELAGSCQRPDLADHCRTYHLF